MDAFTVHTGTAVPLRRSNVDTDQIIPAVYLKRVTRTGFEDGLFSAWRANEPDFVLNQDRVRRRDDPRRRPGLRHRQSRASTRCGRCWTTASASSSRRGSATSSAATRSRPGCSRCVLPEKIVQRLWDDIEEDPATQVTVDLVERQVRWSGEVHDFELDDYTRWRLIEGLDDIGLTLRHVDDIAAYEQRRQAVVADASPRSERREAPRSTQTKIPRRHRALCVPFRDESLTVTGTSSIAAGCPVRERVDDTMNKVQFIEALAERLDGDRKQAAQVLDAVIDTVYAAVARGERVALTGFGIFERRERAARTARNPAHRRERAGEEDRGAGVPCGRGVQGDRQRCAQAGEGSRSPRSKVATDTASAARKAVGDTAATAARCGEDRSSGGEGREVRRRPTTKAAAGTTASKARSASKAAGGAKSTRHEGVTAAAKAGVAKATGTKSAGTKVAATKAAGTKAAGHEGRGERRRRHQGRWHQGSGHEVRRRRRPRARRRPRRRPRRRAAPAKSSGTKARREVDHREGNAARTTAAQAESTAGTSAPTKRGQAHRSEELADRAPLSRDPAQRVVVVGRRPRSRRRRTAPRPRPCGSSDARRRAELVDRAPGSCRPGCRPQ